ncbi:MAG: hypothetical protein GY757_35155 [bacterium]|nr:hypothetical protein [bacterium]
MFRKKRKEEKQNEEGHEEAKQVATAPELPEDPFQKTEVLNMRIKLGELISDVDMLPESCSSYLDKETGECYYIS